jgi:hypothetical protein
MQSDSQLALHKPKHDMNRIRLPTGRDFEPACLEYLQHCGIVRQNIGDQLFEAGLTSKDY